MAGEVRDVDNLLGGVVKDLVKDHGGVRAVARLVPTSPSTISRWQAGHVGLSQLGVLARALNVTVTVTLPPAAKATVETKESPPAWAEGLMTRDEANELTNQIIAKVIENRDFVATILTTRIVEGMKPLIEELLQPHDGAPSRVGDHQAG